MFYKPASEIVSDVNRFYKELMCIVDDPILMGDYNSAAAKMLVFTFTMCKNQDYCEDEAVIKHWMARKFILTLENSIFFNKDVVDDIELLNKKSQLVWFPVSPQLKTDYYNIVHISELDLADKIIDVGVRKEQHRIFDISQEAFKPWDFPGDIQVSITYELSRDLNQINRKVYSILEYLGDMGGLAGALFALFTVAVMIFQFKSVNSYLSNHTYLIREGED
jgi:hypothetical protein